MGITKLLFYYEFNTGQIKREYKQRRNQGEEELILTDANQIQEEIDKHLEETLETK